MLPDWLANLDERSIQKDVVYKPMPSCLTIAVILLRAHDTQQRASPSPSLSLIIPQDSQGKSPVLHVILLVVVQEFLPASTAASSRVTGATTSGRIASAVLNLCTYK
jgi:hypothetical protein